MPFERQAFHKLVLVAAGAGVLDLTASAAPLAAGSLLLVPAGTRHRFRDDPGSPMTLVVVCVTAMALRATGRARQAWATLARDLGACRPHAIEDGDQVSELARRVRALVFEQTLKRAHWELVLEAGWLDLLAAALRARTKRPDDNATTARQRALLGTISWIEGHFREPVRIAALARRAGISYRSYTNHFRDATGVTVSVFVADLRTRYAAERIRQGTPIIDAALESGFSDLSHFYRTFKRCLGVTPGRVPSLRRPS